MESKLNRQKNLTISLKKSKHTNIIPQKQNTWSNILNKKSICTNAAIAPKEKSIQNSITKSIIKSKSNSEPSDDLPNGKLCQTLSLSVFNPVRTLQFLLREILELPSVQNTDIKKILDEMQVVVRRIANESSENVSYSKSHLFYTNENSMIPTRENDYYKDLKYEYNPEENKYWLVLLGKISELENNYSHLTKNYTKSEEKLLYVTSERDKLMEKFKESCDSLEMLNNREHEYLDTIMKLKSKLTVSEKLIIKQEATIINLNKKLNSLPNKNQVLEIKNMPTEQYNLNKVLFKKENELKQDNNFTKFNLNDKSKIIDFKGTEVANLGSDIKQMKQIVLTGLDNHSVKSTLITLTKSEENDLFIDVAKDDEDNKKDSEPDIDSQYTEYNRQVSAIKLAKTEFQQLFEAINTQAHLSRKLFTSTSFNNDISDDEDNHSNTTNFISVVTESNC